MKRYVRLLASYAVIAITAMVLYTPWLVGLSPSDPSILRAGLSVIFGIILAGSFGASTYGYLHQPQYKLLESGEVDEPDDVLPELQAFSSMSTVGRFASESVNQIETMERRRTRLYRVIEATFGAESLSFGKFAAVVDSAERTLLRNCALLANRIQTFDVEGYRKTKRLRPSANVARDGLPADSLEAERAAVYQDALDDMQEIIEANERLLLEMGKLEMELSDLETDDNREGNTRMLDEVKDLVEQTRYYR